MAKKTADARPSKRKPRVLWANTYCLLDTSSGASMSVREMLRQLVAEGYEVRILGCTIFDNPKGVGRLQKKWSQIAAQRHQVVEIDDEELTHQLLVTQNTYRHALTSHEEMRWHSQYLYLLDQFKPDLVWFYGGLTLDFLIPAEARIRGIPSAFYVANENYPGPRWNQDIDLILTDSQATAELYQAREGFKATPVGKFIDPKRFVADRHERTNLLVVNPDWEKGASIVVQLALLLEQERPDIRLEVVEARSDWSSLLREVTERLGAPRENLANVIVTPNTRDMRPVYERARVLLAPSLWWESGARVLPEALLNGIPAVVSDRGGSQELIGDAGAVLSFPDACHQKPYKHLLPRDALQPLYEAVIAFFDDQVHYEHYVQRAYQVAQEKHDIRASTARLTRALAPLINQRAGDKDFVSVLRRMHKHRLGFKAGRPDFYMPAAQASASASAVGTLAQRLAKNAEQTAPAAGSAAPAPPSAPVKDASAFDWHVEGKLVVLDNRAHLIQNGVLETLRETQAFSIVAFDPASEVLNPQQYEGQDDLQLFRHALLGNGEPATLHACIEPALSSTLEPLPPEQLPEHLRQGAQVLTTLPISTVALDRIEGLGSLDWLILDDLSDVISILEHGSQALQQALVIQVKTAARSTHHRQPGLAEIKQWMTRQGFQALADNDSNRGFAQGSESRRQLAEELQSMDTLFIPSDERLQAITGKYKEKLGFLLHTVFKAHEVAYRLMRDVNEARAAHYWQCLNGGSPHQRSTGYSEQEHKILEMFKARAAANESLKAGEKGLFIDCGGYDGCSSIKFKINNPGFDCVTFEPNPTLWPYYDGLPTTLIKKAAFTYNGEIKFTLDNIDEDGSSVIRKKRIDFTGQLKNSQLPTIKAECIDLAEFIETNLESYDKIILKLDVEGAEYDILEQLIARNLNGRINAFYCEFHWEKCGIPKKRHDQVISKIEETSILQDWDALDFSIHKRGEQAKQLRKLILGQLVSESTAFEAETELDEIILHIGMHRTGTTTLQEKFFPQVKGFQGRSKVKHGGWGYDECSKLLLTASRSQEQVALQQFFDCAKNQSRMQNIQRIIFSNEALLEPINWSTAPFTKSGKKARSIAVSPVISFLERAAKYHGGTLKIIFIFRNQADWLASFYSRVSEQIQNASQEDFERQLRFILKDNAGWIDWNEWVGCLSKIVGPENTLFLPMEMIREHQYWHRISIFLGSDHVIYDGSQNQKNRYSLDNGAYRLQFGESNEKQQEEIFFLTDELRRLILTTPKLVSSNRSLEERLGINLSQYGYFYGANDVSA